MVVYLVDKDDCSLPPGSDLGDPSQAGADAYGPLSSFRCVQFGIACGNPPMPIPYGDSHGNLAPCQDADPSVNKLIPVSKYIDFFTKPASQGGIKIDPRDVILADLSPPADDVATIVFGPGPYPPGPYMPCMGPLDGVHCAVALQSSCVPKSGYPAVRLRQTVGAASNRQDNSSCDSSYQAAMQNLGQMIVTRVQ